MTCAGSNNVIGFYLMVFVGIALGGLFVAPLGDKYGRKRLLLIGLSSLIVTYVGILTLVDNFNKLHYCMLIYGVILAVNLVNVILLMMQNMEKANWPATLLVTLCFLSAISLGIALFFLFLTQSWRFLFLFVLLILCLVSFYVFLSISESLRHLYDTDQYEELNRNLIVIYA
jgi:MFS family permease